MLFWRPNDVVLTFWTLYRRQNDDVCVLGWEHLLISTSSICGLVALSVVNSHERYRREFVSHQGIWCDTIFTGCPPWKNFKKHNRLCEIEFVYITLKIQSITYIYGYLCGPSVFRVSATDQRKFRELCSEQKYQGKIRNFSLGRNMYFW